VLGPGSMIPAATIISNAVTTRPGQSMSVRAASAAHHSRSRMAERAEVQARRRLLRAGTRSVLPSFNAFNLPRFGGAFFVGNWCCRGSCRPGLLLGERALKELPERYCARGNFRPRAAPVLERLIQWPLQSDLDGGAGLYRGDVSVIGHVHLMRGTGARRDMPLRPARARRKCGR
jgi:hypothetical protein